MNSQGSRRVGNASWPVDRLRIDYEGAGKVELARGRCLYRRSL